MNVTTNIPCKGAKITPLNNRNIAEQENMIGVVRNTLYGLSSIQIVRENAPLQGRFSYSQYDNSHRRELYEHNSMVAGLIPDTNSKP